MLGTLVWLWMFWRHHKKRMALIVAMGILSAGLRMVNPLIIRHIIDGLKVHLTAQYIIQDVLLILGVGISLYIVNLVAQANRAYMNVRLEWEIRQKVFSHIVGLDQGFYHRYRTGDLVTRLVDDIHEKLSWFACSGIFRFVQSCFTFLAILIAMLVINPRLTVWVLLPLPLILFLYIRCGHEFVARYNVLQTSISDIFGFLEACFTGIRVVKANSKEASQMKAFGNRVEAQRNAEVSTARLNAFFSNFFHYAGFFCIAFVFIGGGRQVMNGTATLGDLVAFQFFTYIIVWPLLDMSSFVVRGKRASVSVARLQELLKASTSVVEPAQPKICHRGGEPGKGDERKVRLEFRDVHYRPAGGDDDLLKGIGFDLQGGQRVAVVGRIGSGKSLLVSLIPRLVEATGGKILINGVDIRDMDLRSLRNLVGYVPQEPGIFSDTLLYNMTFGRKEISPSELDRAVEAAQIAREIKDFPRGLETVAGPRGTTLSGGQRQRITLARALVARPGILILDDCTSAMDAQTEDRLWKALLNYLPDSLYLIITHRSQTIAGSDWILTMDGGTVVEAGTHEHLMQWDSLYRKIYQRHKLEEELKKGDRPIFDKRR